MKTIRRKTKRGGKWTAEALRKMPASERDAILREAAKRAEADYRGDNDLTGFEAFGGKDLLHG